MSLLKYTLMLLLILPNLSFAKTLLVISSGLGMYGDDDKTNIAIERFGSNLVENALSRNYRKVYTFVTYEHGKGNTANKELLSLLNKIVSERKGNENLDVFSMQHGPDSLPFDGLEIEDIKNIIPYGFIENVYSTSCSEFGTFKASTNDNILILDRNPEFSENLKTLGVKNYIYHANDNATGVFTLPLIISFLRDSKDWRLSAEKTYEKFDDMSSQLIPALKSLFENKKLKEMLPSLLQDQDWESLFNSRMVIGSSTPTTQKSMMETKNIGSIEEKMIPMKDSLINALAKYCPKGLAPDMSCKGLSSIIPLNRIFATVFEHIHSLLDIYDSSSESCLRGEVINPLLGIIDFNAEVREICLSKKDRNHYVLNWKLKTKSILHFRGTIKSELSELRKITLSRNGSLSFQFKESLGLTEISAKGLKIFLNGFDGSGSFKHFSKARLRSLKIDDNGSSTGRIRLFIFPIVAGVENQNIEEITMPDFIKVFGIKVWNNKSEQ